MAVVAALTTALPPPVRAASYAFPIEGDRDVLWWEESHWDGALAVDIGIHPSFGPGSPERSEFYRRNVTAVISGTASRLDNPRGGIAVLLHGDDNRTYYYAHLSGSTIEEPRLVRRGEPLGTIGRTGMWTQFLEPHLHFEIAKGHQTGTGWSPDVDPVAWIERTFGSGPSTFSRESYREDEPTGVPLFGRHEIHTTFADAKAMNPLLAGITVAATGGGRAPVRAPVTGVARIHRDTPLGVRLQITNVHADWSVIISGDIDPLIRHGELVHRESVIGFAGGPLHYMAFHRGQPVDPVR
jgi:murein DD-endopeptidase MepM/ murein hydrolase activator NlpD